MDSIANRIRRARTLGCLTQADLAGQLGVSRSAVTQWERCQGGTTPSVDHLTRIACTTGVCFEWLATGRGRTVPEGDEFVAAAALHDFASDELESRALQGMKRLNGHKKEVAARILELLSSH
jgi:transcriptional regulator with XRE-family HTH domain